MATAVRDQEVTKVSSPTLAAVRVRTLVPFVQCAWCHRINILGRYVRIPRLRKTVRHLSMDLPLVGQVQVTLSHGICPRCGERVCREAFVK